MESADGTRRDANDGPDMAVSNSDARDDNSATAATVGAVTIQEKMARDAKLRKQRLYTAYLFLSFMALGMAIAVHGPTFLDLVMILNVDIETGSFLFTGCSIGYITGSLIGGVIYDKVNKELALFVSIFFMGVFTALVPWCKNLVFMCFMNAFRGCMEGILDAEGNAVIFHIWKTEAAPYMQAVQFAFGFGAIIAPLIAEPFLFKKADIDGALSNNTPATFTYIQPNLSTTSSYLEFSETTFQSISIDTIEVNFTYENVSSPSVSTTDFQSSVYIPYLIVGIFAALTALPFLQMYWSSRKEATSSDVAKATTEKPEDIRHIPLTNVVKATFFVLIGAFYFTYACVEDTFTGFILTFVVKHLKWSKTNGTLITSVFWITFSVGRLMAIGLAKFLTSWKMLVLNFVFFDLGFLALVLGVETSDVLCWLATGVAGLAMGSVFPTGMTWIDEKIFLVTGKVTAYIMVFASIGMMANPILCGYLFETYTPMAFIYLLFSHTLLCTLIFILMTLLVIWVRRKWKSRRVREGRGDSPPRNPVTNQTLIVESTNI